LAVRRSLRTWALQAAFLVCSAFLLSGCEGGPLNVLGPGGENARKADELWNLTFSIAVGVFVLVQGALVFAVVRYRHKPGRQAAQFHGNTKVEVILTAIPALILATIGFRTVGTIFDLAHEPQGEDVLEVNVQGRQFWWVYEYPDLEVVTANELHIPTGTPVALRIEGFDVNHSFWVPRLSGAQDMVPGRANGLTIEADEPGTYWGQCKEFCGLSHANMRLRVIAHDPADFDTWVSDQKQPAQQPSDALAAEGAELFVNGAANGRFEGGPACATCHAIDGLEGAVGVVGPNLTHFKSRKTFAGAMFENSEPELRAWLNDPPGQKPGVLMPNLRLTDDEIDALVAYLETLE
jgi:cytochrome c oxidase subunit II